MFCRTREDVVEEAKKVVNYSSQYREPEKEIDAKAILAPTSSQTWSKISFSD